MVRIREVYFPAITGGLFNSSRFGGVGVLRSKRKAERAIYFSGRYELRP